MNQVGIIRTERGLAIAGTRITIYDVLDYVKAHYPPKFISSLLELTDEQINVALSYIEENRHAVEAEYNMVLKQAEENRQYWEERNRQHLAHMATISPQPGKEKLWAKLQAQKARHAGET